MRTTLHAVRRPRSTARAWLTRTRRTATIAATALGVLSASALAYAVTGIDASHWQGDIAWAKVRADGVTFAFLKATEGSGYTDPTYAANSAAAQRNGIFHGGYHFARPSVGTADSQARYFAAHAGPFNTAGTLPPVLDLEQTGGLSVSQLRTWTANWLSTVEELTGRTPMIYVSPSFWQSHLGNSTAFHHYPLWVAHWGVSSPTVPGGWPTWTFWQRTDAGSVNGIAGLVDMNRFNGTSAQLATLALSSGGSTDPVPPGPTVPTGDATAVTLAPSVSTVSRINGPVTLSGALTSTPTGTAGGVTPSPVPVAGATLAVYARGTGTTAWKQLGSATSAADGSYTYATKVLSGTDYQVRWAGDAAHAASVSPVRTVTTPPRSQLALDLKTTKLRVAAGKPAMLYGHLTRAATGAAVAGRIVRLYKKPLRGGVWRLVGQCTSLAPTGWFSWTVRPLHPRVYKAVVASTDYVIGATSNHVTVRVG